MRRRRFIACSVAAGLAGCTGGEVRESETPPPTSMGPVGPTPDGSAPELPNGVYVQRFRESMAMQGTTRSGEFAAGVMYTSPHEFWNVVGSDLQPTPRTGDVHLMAVVWDPETGTVLPEAGVTVEISKGGDLVSQEVIYPMLSQRMGFHYGGNFSLDGDGEYVAGVSVGGLSVRRTGGFAGRFGDPTTLEIPFAFTDAEREKVGATELGAYGRRGAVRPMEMGTMPQALAPAEEDLPGVVGSVRSDDAVFVLGETTPPEGIAGDRYLYASTRTPYNRLVLPAMAVSASVEDRFDGPLERTLDPDLGYHYGAVVDGGVNAGDRVTLTPTTPPQVARHEGYERAFLRMEPATLTV